MGIRLDIIKIRYATDTNYSSRTSLVGELQMLFIQLRQLGYTDTQDCSMTTTIEWC
jgi:hypothetical protein